MEIFSSCSISNLRIDVPALYPDESIRFSIRALESFDLPVFQLPGLGLERRDFRRISREQRNLKNWGEGAKRLELSVLHESQGCNHTLSGKTYMLRAYHMTNIGHLYETIFRLFFELKKRQDLMNVKRIIFLNVESSVPYIELFSHLFPGIEIMSPIDLKDTVCFSSAIFVGFPNHSLGRPETTQADMNSFNLFLQRQFKLIEEVSTSGRPLIVFMSRRKRSGNRPRRFLENELELAEYLRARTNWDVRIVSMQELDFRSQAKLMFQTSILISVHTAGFYNVLFMKPSSIVLQINVPGTHFGTSEYESRPQLPLWRRGVWQLNIESVCKKRSIKFLEIWAKPDYRHAENFVGTKKLKRMEIEAKYKEWVIVDNATFVTKWKQCEDDKHLHDCEMDMANEMRAHNTADNLTVSKDELWYTLSPHINKLTR